MDLKTRIQNTEEYVLEKRRYFHENPELPWQEFNTSKHIQEELDKMGISYVTGAQTAVIGSIKGTKPGKVLAIRADIDALPVCEMTDLPFASKTEGIMHACGHDAHAGILLGAAKILNEMKDELAGEVRLVFQPAEEDIANSGAAGVLKTGYLQDVDRIIALHVMTTSPSGTAQLKGGPLMASADTFDIHITGKGGHGAMPSISIDPVVAGAMAIQALQTFVSRENNPSDTSVLTVASFHAGDAYNVIPEEAHLKGTTRTVSNDVRKGLENKMRRILDGVALTTRTRIELDYHLGSPATINDYDASALGESILADLLGEGFTNKFPTVMGSEDFSRYLVEIPGCMMFLGAAPKDGPVYPHHNELFKIEESVLITGVEYFVRYALAYLAS